jgi:hypothetical protein
VIRKLGSIQARCGRRRTATGEEGKKKTKDLTRIKNDHDDCADLLRGYLPSQRRSQFFFLFVLFVLF